MKQFLVCTLVLLAAAGTALAHGKGKRHCHQHGTQAYHCHNP